MVNILDCTIRDGSYVTNYQWDNLVIKSVVSALSKAGIPYIEIGNGTGLGTHRKIKHAKPDVEYFRYSMKYKGTARIGAFFIPGIGSYDDITKFYNEGGDFIRIGVNATDISKAIQYIEYAKSIGLEVFCNLMKTYSISIYKLAYTITPLIDTGVDCIYIVDSAGGMSPLQVKEYFDAIRDLYNISVGFHGHNNLLLANANSYMAAISGAKFVDATLMSLGRGAGNAQLESITALLQKCKLIDESVNLNLLCDVSVKYISSLMNTFKTNHQRDIIIGISNFHDSYLPMVEKYAKKYGVDTYRLITEVSKVNIVNPSDDLFNLIASKIANNKIKDIYYPKFFHKKY